MVDMDCAFGLMNISGVTDCIRYHQGNQHSKLHCTKHELAPLPGFAGYGKPWSYIWLRACLHSCA